MAAKFPTSVATDADLSIAVNSLQTTLSGAIDNAVTSIPLTSTTSFPTAGYVTIDNEVISYTGVSGGNLTGATRGADGTAAASHLSAAAVSATIVAAHHNNLKDEVKAIETSLGAGYLSTAALPKAGGTMTGPILLPNGSVSAPSIAFSGATGNGIYYVAGTFNVATAGIGVLQLSDGTYGAAIYGTRTNDNQAAGYVGEYVKSAVTAVSSAANATWGNVTSISLTAGDWDVSCLLNQINNGATQTGIFQGAISAFSGNTTTDHAGGDNTISQSTATTNNNQSSVCIPVWRVSIASTTTIYLKGWSQFTAGTPQFYGRISARRVR